MGRWIEIKKQHNHDYPYGSVLRDSGAIAGSIWRCSCGKNFKLEYSYRGEPCWIKTFEGYTIDEIAGMKEI